MQDLFIEFLPPWVETGLQPAFYDRESGTVLQQTARMYAKLNEVIKIVNGYQNYDEEIASLKAQMSGLIAENERFKLNLQVDINNQMVAFKQDVTKQIIAQMAGLKAYVDTQDESLREYIDEISLGQIELYNPATGEKEDIQSIIDELYDMNRTDAITATEYDGLELTADDYEAYDLTATEYDMHAKSLLV